MDSPFSDTELARLRADFPILSRTGRGGKPIVYLDAAATSQKPRSVMQAESSFYENSNGAVHRGTHLLADESSQYFEDARAKLAGFVGACPEEIVWTKNATEALNLVAYGLSNPGIDGGAPLIGKGDRVVTTRAEHHANLVPWQLLSQRTGCEFAYLDLDREGRIDLETLDAITANTKVVAVTHASNVSGAITDIAPIIQAAHAVGAGVVLDTCQSSAHMPLDVKALGADFACFSGHKMAGPTGIGALYGRRELLEQLPPFLAGGSMIADVTMDKTSFQPLPERFEAGSQAVAQIHAWAVALDYLQEVGMERIRSHELALTKYLLAGLATVKDLRLLGPADYHERVGLAAFDFAGIHPHDVGQVLDAEDVAIRVGHHCALPLHAHYGLRSSCRASLSLTSSREDIDRLIAALEVVRSFFLRGN